MAAALQEAGGEALRVDKWLWHARLARSRAVAARIVAEGGLRVNGARARKPAAPVRAGDVLTFAHGGAVRVVRVLALGLRRGPAPEARLLYDDLDPPVRARAGAGAPAAPASGARDAGAGRPTKQERRALDRLRRDP